MPYNPNIPQPTERIADSQPQILGNFSYIQTAMQEDHAWNGNEINGQADGTHQQVSLPNQPADITGALPTGIAAIEYAIGGNLYTWNGAKNAVSSISGSGLVNISSTPATIISNIPNDCIGFVTIGNPASVAFPKAGTGLNFFCIAGTPNTLIGELGPQNISTAPQQPQLILVFSGQNVQVQKVNGNNLTNVPYKYIYWPI